MYTYNRRFIGLRWSKIKKETKIVKNQVVLVGFEPTPPQYNKGTSTNYTLELNRRIDTCSVV